MKELNQQVQLLATDLVVARQWIMEASLAWPVQSELSGISKEVVPEDAPGVEERPSEQEHPTQELEFPAIEGEGANLFLFIGDLISEKEPICLLRWTVASE